MKVTTKRRIPLRFSMPSPSKTGFSFFFSKAGLRDVQRAGAAAWRGEAAGGELQPARALRGRHGHRHRLRGHRAAGGAPPAAAADVGPLGLR